MRLIHTSDWHLGKIFFGKKILEEQQVFFENIFFPLLKDIKPDLLIITGDLVDKPIPDYETLKTLEEILYQIFEVKIPTFIILGNHDSKRMSLYKEFLKAFNLIIEDGLKHLLNPLEFISPDEETLYFYFFPYLSPLELKDFIEKIYPESFKNFFISKNHVSFRDLVIFLFSNLRSFLKKPAILLGHFAVEKSVFTKEELSLRGIGGEELFPSSLLKDFDLILLGHLHRIQKVDSSIYYAGSIIPYSFEEANHQKGIWLIEIKNKRVVKAESIFLDSPLKLKVIKGYFKDLLFYPKDFSYIKIILKDSSPIYNPFERLRINFPNLLTLEYESFSDNSSLQAENSLWLEDNLLEKEKIELDEETLFKNFYQTIEGKEVDLQILKVFKQYVNSFKAKLEGGE